MKYAVICFSSREVACMVDCRISHNTSETLNENIMQYIDHDNGGLLMRKVIACFLTIALVLFAFTACENKTSTPDTGGSDGETTIQDADCVTISYPDFYKDLESLF